MRWYQYLHSLLHPNWSAIGNIFQLPTKPKLDGKCRYYHLHFSSLWRTQYNLSLCSLFFFSTSLPLSMPLSPSPSSSLSSSTWTSYYFVCFKLSLPIVYELFVAALWYITLLLVIWMIISLCDLCVHYIWGANAVHCCAHHQHWTTEFWKQSVGHKIWLSADVFKTLFHPLMKKKCRVRTVLQFWIEEKKIRNFNKFWFGFVFHFETIFFFFFFFIHLTEWLVSFVVDQLL